MRQNLDRFVSRLKVTASVTVTATVTVNWLA